MLPSILVCIMDMMDHIKIGIKLELTINKAAAYPRELLGIYGLPSTPHAGKGGPQTR